MEPKQKPPTTNKEMAKKTAANITMNRFITENAHLMRSQLMAEMFNIGKDINSECGYPDVITREHYASMYQREGVAKRSVNVLPEETWVERPEVTETKEADETEFDKAWVELEKKYNLYHYLERIDKLSGIGQFGVLLLGINDGLSLEQPVAGINDKTGEPVGENSYELLYVRPYQESVVTVDAYETDVSSPRYGMPVLYTILFQEQTSVAGQHSATQRSTKVHWTRLIHIADNREMSDTFGAPRMEPLYNRLLDIRKVLSGSGEMFWKGAFPGYSFEINPELEDPNIDYDEIKQTFEDYSNGLQRYLAMVGVTAKSLAPQVADPKSHVETQLKIIAVTLGIPWRILVGSEAAQLASGQDKETLNARIQKRQENYATPLLIRPFVDRLLALGILPSVETYVVVWPDLDTPTDKDKAEVAGKKTEALAKYVGGNVDHLIPPHEFLTMIMGMDKDEVDAIITAVTKHLEELAEEEATELAAAEEEAEIAEAQRRKQDADAGVEPGAATDINDD